MAERAIWSGVISFGMVTIPVRLHTATRPKDIRFHLLHSTDNTRVVQKRWCPVDDEEVPWSEVVRGYEYAKGKYVVLTDEDFAQLPLPSKHTVEISAFVEASEIDPVFYEKAYYLAPDERGEKPYALLLQALEDKGLVAMATITMRKKEQLCSIRPHEGTLLLDTLFYPDEVRVEPEVDVESEGISKDELTMAHRLVDLLRKPFDPAAYHDRYREALAELIDAKLEGKEVVTAPPPREPKVIDLREALARSVAEAKGKRPAKQKSRPAARRRTRKSANRKAG